jgi:fatty-acyl-CoA synthase
VVSGPAVFAGYTDAALNAGKLLADAVDGSTWLDSGDLGQIDSDGFVWLAGRSKDLIIRGGHNLDPATIEDALCEHPAVAAAAAVGMPDVRVGELPVAFVELQPQKLVTEEELRQFCTGRVADRAAEPVRVQVIPALPRTAMLKIFKPELRRLAAEAAVRASLDAVAWRGERPQVIVGLDATGTLHAVIEKVADLDAESGARVRQLLDQLGLAVRDD